jgi:uncharacterized membrane protein required for colicin V production
MSLDTSSSSLLSSAGLFDLIVIVVLVVGILCGRKHGMSEELIKLLQWLAILFGCATIYQWGGQKFGEYTGLFGQLTRYILAYVVVAVLITLLFGLIKRGLGGKLAGSDVFGRTEYYLGMASGLLRFSCMLLVALALLNARCYSSTEVRAMQKFQNDVYGSDFFPTLYSIQHKVFEESITGRCIKQNLYFLLITTTEPDNKEVHMKDAVLP